MFSYQQPFHLTPAHVCNCNYYHYPHLQAQVQELSSCVGVTEAVLRVWVLSALLHLMLAATIIIITHTCRPRCKSCPPPCHIFELQQFCRI